MIGERPFGVEKEEGEAEVEGGGDADHVCDQRGEGDLRRPEDLRCEVCHSSEEDELMETAPGGVANCDAEDMEKKDLWPWISPHRRVASRGGRDGGGGRIRTSL